MATAGVIIGVAIEYLLQYVCPIRLPAIQTLLFSAGAYYLALKFRGEELASEASKKGI